MCISQVNEFANATLKHRCYLRCQQPLLLPPGCIFVLRFQNMPDAAASMLHTSAARLEVTVLGLTSSQDSVYLDSIHKAR